MFPAERIPDGALMAPHHFLIGVLAALVVVLLVWNDRGGIEPAYSLAALTVALFAWVFVWRYYPVTGAAGVLAGLSLASFAVYRPVWRGYPWRVQAGYALALAVAWDDGLSHALGIWTPLDWFWRVWLGHVII
ncbi:hypothetical protein [Haladaptatus sp. DYF46]|uniref:hypothetical protein n=1 Tax=Haladaptatus sp. DYF46 TaxID=2886041 RepID=UPI001E3C5CEA|nr:hypothetical protein [Haladaptatus sp. DYF46]